MQKRKPRRLAALTLVLVLAVSPACLWAAPGDEAGHAVNVLSMTRIGGWLAPLGQLGELLRGWLGAGGRLSPKSGCGPDPNGGPSCTSGSVQPIPHSAHQPQPS